MRWSFKNPKAPEWERVFAWFPVQLGPRPSDNGDMVWWEYVERKFITWYGCSYYEYRLPVAEEKTPCR
jgi:hypothetical protein